MCRMSTFGRHSLLRFFLLWFSFPFFLGFHPTLHLVNRERFQLHAARRNPPAECEPAKLIGAEDQVGVLDLVVTDFDSAVPADVSRPKISNTGLPIEDEKPLVAAR